MTLQEMVREKYRGSDDLEYFKEKLRNAIEHNQWQLAKDTLRQIEILNSIPG